FVAAQREGGQARALRAAVRVRAAHQPRRGLERTGQAPPERFQLCDGRLPPGDRRGQPEALGRRDPRGGQDQYREPEGVDAFSRAALATDPTSATRNPPSLRAPNGVLEDSFYQATGRPLWNAANIGVPTLVIAGEDDTWSFPQDREGLMRDLTNAPYKKS